MSKFLKVLFFSMACSIVLFGCSGESDNVNTETPSETPQQNQSEVNYENESSNKTEEEIIDLNDEFGGINGCMVLYNPLEDRYYFYNEEMAKEEVSPYSTFKIVSTLAGLNNGVIKDKTSTMNYSGVQYPNPEWNANLTLEEAFQTSCIWYFRQVIDSVGYTEMQNEINELDYGNKDLSEWEGSNINSYEELNGFWLSSSLKISPFEQTKILSQIFEGKSIYNSQNIEILKEIMLIQNEESQKIYGKTGSGSNGEAWFVGFMEEAGQRIYFSTYLSDSSKSKEISGNMAKEITLNVVTSRTW